MNSISQKYFIKKTGTCKILTVNYFKLNKLKSRLKF